MVLHVLICKSHLHQQDYMVKQKMITEEKVNGKIVYQIRKD